MNYTLSQLNVFVKVVENQSVTKAAEHLHMTQPAVSIQLKNFQDQFEIPLFEVISRRMHITSFGQEVAASLKISVVSTGKYVIPYFLTGFMKQHEGIELEMNVTNKNRVIESLQKNEVDFAMVSIIPENTRIEKIDLMTNLLYLVGNRETNIRKNMPAEDIFKKLPLIFRETGSGTRQIMEQFISENQISVNKKLELTSNEAIKQAILAGLGCSIMPVIGIRKEIQDKDLTIIPVKGLPIETTWSLIWLKDKKLSPTSQAFLNYLSKEKQNIIRNNFG